MTKLSHSVAGVYLEVVLFVIVIIIILTVLIIELLIWYSSTQHEQIEKGTSNTIQCNNTVEMSIPSPETVTTTPTVQSPSPNSVPDETPISHRLLPISSYILYIICINTMFFFRFAVGINHDCDYLRIGGFFYMAAKCCLYLVLLHRLYKVYNGIIFLKKRIIILKIAAIFTCVWGLFVAILNAIVIQKVIVIIDGNRYCASVSPPIVFIFLVFYDLIMNIGCCYAFTRPLLWITKMKNKNSNQANEIYATVVRYIVLTFVAIISTFLIMTAAVIVEFNDIAFLDMAINSICIMMFNRVYAPYYYCLCCGAHKTGNCIIDICCYESEKEEPDKEIQINI